MSAKQGAVELRSEWYQVHYNLAAHRAHLALETQREHHFLNLGARERAIEIARLAEAAEDEIRLTLLTAVKTLDWLEKAERSGANTPGDGHGEVSRRAVGRENGGSDKGDEFVDAALKNFLSQTVEPASAVLLAGLMAIRPRKRRRDGHDAEEGMAVIALPAPGRSEVAEIAAQRDARDDTARDTLIEFASQGTPSYRVRYNLACYWSELLPDDPEQDDATGAEKSMEELRQALMGAPVREAPRLAAWAEVDPTLEWVRRAREDDFIRLTALFKLPLAKESTG
jgi:hypothetical protein